MSTNSGIFGQEVDRITCREGKIATKADIAIIVILANPARLRLIRCYAENQIAQEFTILRNGNRIKLHFIEKDSSGFHKL